ncbi:anti-sigma-F factor Fin family protein [Paenibacillus aurantius]|uniref:Anti-sigma-F factor Fin family protein n=1 Tax=Paenibacillus aurantius TaxID=2918900 RepID=A0AA96LGJ3_9BACL|nr:anti-sigma-F factor Fin family protein [Paenibacillus aurantius]WJH36369.1 anti-sigma-F factor Fin family protein [Paenibacillus sp. CC-CFT747]WNQ11675.1 anti-sigma-F factor Fin family protein [Paenibacillus aurantius]
MAIKYVCRHCRTTIGELDSGAVSEQQLGLHFLTPEERSDIIAYNLNGDMTVKVVCDYCREALAANPELSLLASPLQ